MAWRDGQVAYARKLAEYFLEGSKEGKAAAFLLGRTAAEDREQGFREEFSEEDVWFGDTIIGERYFKGDEMKKALEAYERAYNGIERVSPEKKSDLDKLMVERVKARLYELRNETQRPDTGPRGPDK